MFTGLGVYLKDLNKLCLGIIIFRDDNCLFMSTNTSSLPHRVEINKKNSLVYVVDENDNVSTISPEEVLELSKKQISKESSTLSTLYGGEVRFSCLDTITTLRKLYMADVSDCMSLNNCYFQCTDLLNLGRVVDKKKYSGVNKFFKNYVSLYRSHNNGVLLKCNEDITEDILSEQTGLCIRDEGYKVGIIGDIFNPSKLLLLNDDIYITSVASSLCESTSVFNSRGHRLISASGTLFGLRQDQRESLEVPKFILNLVLNEQNNIPNPVGVRLDDNILSIEGIFCSYKIDVSMLLKLLVKFKISNVVLDFLTNLNDLC